VSQTSLTSVQKSTTESVQFEIQEKAFIEMFKVAMGLADNGH